MQKTDTTPSIWKRYRHVGNIALGSLFVLGLLCLAIANIVVRSSWIEVEDGVLWVSKPEGLTAQEIDPGSAAANAGIQIGDVLIDIVVGLSIVFIMPTSHALVGRVTARWQQLEDSRIQRAIAHPAMVIVYVPAIMVFAKTLLTGPVAAFLYFQF